MLSYTWYNNVNYRISLYSVFILIQVRTYLTMYLLSYKKIIPIVILTLITLIGLFDVQVFAHDWYPAACCSGTDCHPISCSSLTEHGKSIFYQGYEFSQTMIHPSEDGLCHVCISNEFNPDTTYSKVPHCVFTAPGV